MTRIPARVLWAERARRRGRTSASPGCSILALAAAGVLLAPHLAAAAEAAAPAKATTLQELIVTASKREEDLHDVPVSADVVTGQSIQDLSIRNLDELSKYAPGLNILEGGEQTSISIRGFGSSLNFGIDQSVGLFIDDIYSGRERQFRGTFLDIDRVEVLKGAQGTLFGKNTIAGAVVITTRQPTQDPSFWIRGEYGPTTNDRTVEAVANGPLTSTLSGRLALRWSQDDGFLHNTLTGQDEEQQQDRIARASLLWTPTDKLTVRTKIEYSDYQRVGRDYVISSISGTAVGRPLTSSPTTLLPITPTDVSAPARLSTYLAYDPKFDVGLNSTTSQQRGTSRSTSGDGAINVLYDFGPVTLRSITGYSRYTADDQRDVDFSPTPLLFEPITQRFHQWSQEFRLVSAVGERFDYVAGLYWFKTHFYVDRRSDVDLNPFFALPIINNPGLKFSQLRFLEQDAETYSGYAQGTWHIVPRQLSLTIGGRWVEETKSASDRLDFAAFGNTRFLDPVNNPGDAALLAQAAALSPALQTQKHAFTGKRSEDNFSPEAKLSWNVDKDVMLYASATKGYNGGGFNSAAATQTPKDFTFQAETSTDYEGGGKFRLLHGAMDVDLALYRQDFSNLQFSAYDGNAGFLLQNVGAARSQGFEGDFRWQATERLQFNGALSAVDAKYTATLLTPCNIPQLNFGAPGCKLYPAPTATNPAATQPLQDLDGKRFAPRYTAAFGAAYVAPVSEQLELLLRADATFSAHGVYVLDATLAQPAHQLLDLSATLRPTQGSRWSVGVLVQNTTNERYYNYVFDAPLQTGTRIGSPAPPRRWTIQAQYQF